VFFINAPIGLAVLLALPRIVPSVAAPRDRLRVDVPGAVLVTAATGLLIDGLINAGSSGWLSAAALAPAGFAVVLYGLFGVRERRAARPLMDIRVLRQRAVATGAFLMLIATGLLIGAFFLGSFYLQHVRGFSALATGLAFLPVAAAVVVGAHTAGRLTAAVDRRVLAAPALTCAALGAGVAAAWPSPAGLIADMSVSALGIGATLVIATTTALADVRPEEAGARSGLVSTFHEQAAPWASRSSPAWPPPGWPPSPARPASPARSPPVRSPPSSRRGSRPWSRRPATPFREPRPWPTSTAREQPPSFARLTEVLGAVAQSGSAPRSHRGGQGFKSPQLHPSFPDLCSDMK
jgi:hypothetical protein